MTEIDGIRTWSYVHKNKVIHKISDQYVKACRRKVRKTVTDGRTDGDPDGRTDGHHHTIIRPVWRRAYKNPNFFWFNFFTLILSFSQPVGMLCNCACYQTEPERSSAIFDLAHCQVKNARSNEHAVMHCKSKAKGYSNLSKFPNKVNCDIWSKSLLNVLTTRFNDLIQTNFKITYFTHTVRLHVFRLVLCLYDLHRIWGCVIVSQSKHEYETIPSLRHFPSSLDRFELRREPVDNYIINDYVKTSAS